MAPAAVVRAVAERGLTLADAVRCRLTPRAK
jgi:hypothetical protein